jgi:hypothetical protein
MLETRRARQMRASAESSNAKMVNHEPFLSVSSDGERKGEPHTARLFFSYKRRTLLTVATFQAKPVLNFAPNNMGLRRSVRQVKLLFFLRIEA